jgi:hypothetical protein
MSERLTDAERRAMLAEDRTGSQEDAELGLIADLLADPSTWAEPDPALEDRVVRAVAAAPAGPATGPASRRRARRGRGRGFLYAASAVAASVAVLAGVVAASDGGGSTADFSSRLTATALAPTARADARISKNSAGFRVELDAHGLRRLTHGAYYQAWLKNARGGLVSIGTFSSSDGAVVLWSGVSPTEYRGITVTVEPDDDDPASSGRRVLEGTLRAT